MTGLCKSIFRNARTKAEYDRALEEAAARQETGGGAGPAHQFDEATALLESGWTLLTQGRTDEALAIAKRLTGDHPDYSRFRSRLAELLIAGKNYIDAVDFLYLCENEEPDNEQYKAMLGTAFARGGTETWTPRGDVVYATAAEHVAEAKQCLVRARECAEALGRRDEGLSQEIATLEENIRIATGRKWDGNALAAIGGLIVPQILFGLPDGSADGIAPSSIRPVGILDAGVDTSLRGLLNGAAMEVQRPGAAGTASPAGGGVPVVSGEVLPDLHASSGRCGVEVLHKHPACLDGAPSGCVGAGWKAGR